MSNSNVVKNIFESETCLGDVISLGDNCEFGFVQRKLGFEPSSLLRWAIARPDDVLAFLKAVYANETFDDFYSFENLNPYAPKMVNESSTNFCFHTRMKCDKKSNNKGYDFVQPLVERKHIWDQEKTKFRYLLEKLLKSLDQGNVFIIKKLEKVNWLTYIEISMYLKKINKRNELIIVSSEVFIDPIPEAVSIEDVNTFKVSSFAPYAAAQNCALEDWQVGVERYLWH